MKPLLGLGVLTVATCLAQTPVPTQPVSGSNAQTSTTNATEALESRSVPAKAAAAHHTDASGTKTQSPTASAAADTTTSGGAGTGVYTTTILGPLNTSDKGRDPNSLEDLLAVPPVPKGKVSLVGGTVRNIDRIKNRLTIQTFGGPRMNMQMDERSHIFRNGVETTQLGINKGDRVYVDTMLDNTKAKIFAKNVHVNTQSPPADAYGQLLSYSAKSGEVTVRDELSGQAVKFRISAATKITNQEHPSTQADLRPGSLVGVRFAAGENRADAEQIDIKALPGSSFTFMGKITHIDMRNNILAIDNLTDDKNYEIKFSPSILGEKRNDLALGSDATIVARFDGPQYAAQSITITGATVSNPEGEPNAASGSTAENAGRDDRKRKKNDDKPNKKQKHPPDLN